MSKVNVTVDCKLEVKPLVPEELARKAYEAYSETTGGVSVVSGAKLPIFDALSDTARIAWKCAGMAVAVHTLDAVKARFDSKPAPPR
jgi:hypothetical protein